jgi:hypothetical protein
MRLSSDLVRALTRSLMSSFAPPRAALDAALIWSKARTSFIASFSMSTTRRSTTPRRYR